MRNAVQRKFNGCMTMLDFFTPDIISFIEILDLLALYWVLFGLGLILVSELCDRVV